MVLSLLRIHIKVFLSFTSYFYERIHSLVLYETLHVDVYCHVGLNFKKTRTEDKMFQDVGRGAPK